MSDDMRRCALSNVDSFPERVLMVRMGALRVAIVGRRMHRWGNFFFMRVESAAPLTVAVPFVCRSYFVFEASLARECVRTSSGVVY